jgi:hypothetical protein
VGFSSQGVGTDLYSCPSGVRLVVLDTPGDGRRGVARIRGFSQEEKSAAARCPLRLESSAEPDPPRLRVSRGGNLLEESSFFYGHVGWMVTVTRKSRFVVSSKYPTTTSPLFTTGENGPMTPMGKGKGGGKCKGGDSRLDGKSGLNSLSLPLSKNPGWVNSNSSLSVEATQNFQSIGPIPGGGIVIRAIDDYSPFFERSVKMQLKSNSRLLKAGVG